jgi:hypothetical protein
MKKNIILFVIITLFLASCTSPERDNIFDPHTAVYEAPASMACMVVGDDQEKKCLPRSSGFADCAAEYGEAFEENRTQFSAASQNAATARCLAARPYLSCLVELAGFKACREPSDPRTCADVIEMGLGAVTPVEEAIAGGTANCASSLPPPE